MLQENPILLYIGVVGAAVVYGIYLFPPLTSPANPNSTDFNQADFEEVIQKELDHCRGNLEDTNCRCYANISGNILTHSAPLVPGSFQADRRELARGQAASCC